MTPVPRRMCLVRSAAKAMKISGERDDLVAGRMVLADPGLVKAELVEPLHQSRSRSRQAVGFSSIGWNGGRKMPCRRLISVIDRGLAPERIIAAGIIAERGRNGDQARKDSAAGHPCP